MFRVLQRPGQRHLAQEARSRGRARRHLRQHHLQRRFPAGGLVARQVDRPHAVAAEFPDDGVASDGLKVGVSALGEFEEQRHDRVGVGLAGGTEEFALSAVRSLAGLPPALRAVHERQGGLLDLAPAETP
jgi:hypothetical protein